MNMPIDRRRFSLLAFTALAAPVALPAHAATRWRLATGYRAESFHTINISTMAREIGLATNGSLSIEVHPDNRLAKLNDIGAAVQAGKAEAGETIMASLVGEMPIAGADSIPFVVGTYADAKRMWRYQRPLLEADFARRGLQVLYAVPWPPQGLYSTRPIASTADFAGSQMRTYNATTARIATLLGARGIDVPMAQVGQALAEGRIDSMITSAVTGVENKVWDHVKYYYPIDAWFPKNVVFVGTKALRGLASTEREALARAAAAAEARGWAASEAAAASSVQELRRNGMKIESVPPRVGADLKRMGERFSLEWIRQVGAPANQIFIPYFTQV